MKNLLFTLLFVLLFLPAESNSLLSSPQKSLPFANGLIFSSGKIDFIKLVSNSTDVALIIANNTTKKLYAIDINDNNPADSASNSITQIPDFTTEVANALGIQSVTILNFEVNPISKSIYVLATDDLNNHYIMVVKNGGESITSLSLADVDYVTISFTTGEFIVQDITWGNNTLYVSSGSDWALDGEVGMISAPFANNSSTTNRATSMFKSNWGGNYFTNAPLEKFDFATINGSDRLLGVTVCAPGFSLETGSLTGSGILQVQEQFDVNSLPPIKTIAVEQNDTSYLFDLHQSWQNNVLIRIGEKYLDGSRMTDNQYDNNRVQLRDAAGNRSPGLTDADVKIYNEVFSMIAFYTDYQFLVLDQDGTLRLFNSCDEVTADFVHTQDSVNNFIFSFNAVSNSNATYLWDFGDGSFDNGQNVTHLYDSAGTYTVYLTVSNHCNNHTTSATITITPSCDSATADFVYHADSINTLAVHFDAVNVPNANYSWDFGDGNSDQGQNVTHAYDSSGIYTVYLTVSNNCNNHTTSKSVTITSPCDSVEANFIYHEDSLNNFTFSFDAVNVPNAAYLWDFGDGNFGHDSNLTYTYNSAGTYTVCLTVNNSCDDDITCKTITIPSCDIVTAMFSYSMDVSAAFKVNFSADSITNGNYFWDYGDGNTNIGRNTSHTYSSDGSYYVCLTADNNCNNDTICKTITISGSSGLKLVEPIAIAVYPNPATEWIAIRNIDNILQNSKLIVYSLDGREVFKNLLIDQNQQISISSLSKGSYFVSILADEQKIFWDILLIQ